jgi:general secretion pathway protein G
MYRFRKPNMPTSRRPVTRQLPSGSRVAVRGFTVIELLTVMSIIGLLAAIAIPRLANMLDKAKVARAIGDVRALQTELMTVEASNQPLPADLSAIGRAGMLDPWGRPYQYFPFPGGVPNGSSRLDRFGVPLNSTFDVYSLGKDGSSVPSVTAGSSQDDVVRGGDGGFIGLGSKF